MAQAMPAAMAKRIEDCNKDQEDADQLMYFFLG